MKISVITISFNQREFLVPCLNSVSRQEGPFEHIIVDPGSTDGSLEIINERRQHFSQIIQERDLGPADGLNKGFSYASGEIFYYLNSDDVVLPGTFSEVRRIFTESQDVDVLCGHGVIIDSSGVVERKIYSDPISRFRLATGGSIQIQPSTFIRRTAYLRSGGFNIENKSNWDGELIVDLFSSGAKFRVVNQIWSGYRIHKNSITSTAKLDNGRRMWDARCFQKLMGRPVFKGLCVLHRAHAIVRYVRHPDALWARLKKGSVYGGSR